MNMTSDEFFSMAPGGPQLAGEEYREAMLKARVEGLALGSIVAIPVAVEKYHAGTQRILGDETVFMQMLTVGHVPCECGAPKSLVVTWPTYSPVPMGILLRPEEDRGEVVFEREAVAAPAALLRMIAEMGVRFTNVVDFSTESPLSLRLVRVEIPGAIWGDGPVRVYAIVRVEEPPGYVGVKRFALTPVGSELFRGLQAQVFETLVETGQARMGVALTGGIARFIRMDYEEVLSDG